MENNAWHNPNHPVFTDLKVKCIFSSPEHAQSELFGSVNVSRRHQQFALDDNSYATEPILTKLHRISQFTINFTPFICFSPIILNIAKTKVGLFKTVKVKPQVSD